MFLAPSNDLEHEFSFGYVSHHGQNGLFKLSLEDMSYTKAIDLTNYGCVPTNIAFVPIGKGDNIAYIEEIITIEV